jgi:hypothetical protein
MEANNRFSRNKEATEEMEDVVVGDREIES